MIRMVNSQAQQVQRDSGRQKKSLYISLNYISRLIQYSSIVSLLAIISASGMRTLRKIHKSCVVEIQKIKDNGNCMEIDGRS